MGFWGLGLCSRAVGVKGFRVFGSWAFVFLFQAFPQGFFGLLVRSFGFRASGLGLCAPLRARV